MQHIAEVLECRGDFPAINSIEIKVVVFFLNNDSVTFSGENNSINNINYLMKKSQLFKFDRNKNIQCL